MESHQYRVFKLPKGGCKFRTIYVPLPNFKRKLQSLLPALHKIAADLDVNNVCHAFVKGRNCVTNAMQHIGYRYTISLDIRDFFDSVRAIHLSGKIPDQILSFCLINGSPRQGLPTSPLIASIALSEIDCQIHESLKFLKTPFSYTRYADDLAISVDEKDVVPKVIYFIRKILNQQGFVINEQKTLIQSSVNGRRIVTGIGVDERGLHATRKTRRAIRAALHQRNYSSAQGLLEWSRCKLPGQSKLKVPELYRRLVSRNEVVCNACREGGLAWYRQNNDRYILIHKESGNQHTCSSMPPPINRTDLELKLREQGFKEVTLSGKTWSKGVSKASANETLLVLFRKRGVDVGLHYRPYPFPTIDYHSLIRLGFTIYRLGYGSNEDNVHAFILELAKQLGAGDAVDRTKLIRYQRID